VLSRNLEKSLHRALACANERRREYATLERLLLSLTEDEDAVAVFRQKRTWFQGAVRRDDRGC
jgi:ATP-dependent Clp protease ATP-binding subunit ClpA